MTYCDYKNGCPNLTWKESTKCIVHCEKNEDFKLENDEFNRFFIEGLINYSLFTLKPDGQALTVDQKNKIKVMFQQEHNQRFYRNLDFKLTEIIFPNMTENDEKQFIRIVNKLRTIYFDKCEIGFTNFKPYIEIECVFEDCTFKKDFNTHHFKPLTTRSEIQYLNCDFRGNFNLIEKDKKRTNYKLFVDCNFNCNNLTLANLNLIEPILLGKDEIDNNFLNINNLLIFSSEVKHDIFFVTKFEHIRIKNIELNYCNVENNVIFKKLKLEKLNITNSSFSDKISAEFIDCEFKLLEIRNSEFKCNTNFFSSIISDLKIIESSFFRFVSFENCKFGGKENKSVEFDYVSFYGFSNFRSTKFNSGLKLDNANFKESPSFFNSAVSYEGTTRETFRMIKNSFDKVGNYIEGNKYFALEMNKYVDNYKNENKGKRDYYFDYIILKFNQYTSNFGQSYVKPIGFILISALLLWGIHYCNEETLQGRIHIPPKSIPEKAVAAFNIFSGHLLPFKNVLITGLESVSLFFYVIFGALIWQTIVAVKRHTKR